MSNLLFKFLKTFKVYALSASLIYTSGPVFAQGGVQAIMGTLGVLKTSLQEAMPDNNQLQQMNPQMNKALQGIAEMEAGFQNVNQALQSGTSRHYIFNNCLVPPDSTPRIENYCQVGAVDPQSMARALTVANQYAEMYENFMKPRNAAVGIGQQCIKDTLNRMQDDAKGLIKKYDEGIEMLRNNIVQAEKLQRQNVDRMKQLSDLLYKGTGSDPNLADVNFNEILGKDCADTFKMAGNNGKGGGGSLNQLGRTNGLLAIRNSFDVIDEAASDFRGPSLEIKRKQIERDIRVLASEYKKGGMNRTSEAKARNKIRSGNWNLLKNAVDTNLAEVKLDTAEVNNILVQLNSTLGEESSAANTLPSIEDPNFTTKMNNMLNSIENRYENKYVLNCLRGQNSALRSSPITSLLEDFRHRNTGKKGTILNAFEDGTIASEISSAKTLDELEQTISRYHNDDIYAPVVNENGKNVFKTLKTLIAEQKEQCQNVYNGTDTTATNDDSLNNFKELLDKVKTKTKSIAKRTIGDSSQRVNIIKELSEQILNCDGQQISTQSCNDNPNNLFSTNSTSFCMKKANFCATKVAQCNQRVQVLKDKYTTEMQNRANQYNAQAELLEKQAQGMINKMKTELTTLAGNLHDQVFPKRMSSAQRASIENSPYLSPDQKQAYLAGNGNSFSVGALAPISLEAEPTKSIIGVDIKGGESLRQSLSKMTEAQMNKMKEKFSVFVNNTLQEAQDISDDIDDNWESERQAWLDLRDQCQDAIAQVEQMEREKAQKDREQIASAQKETTAYCSKLNGVAGLESPTPGCGDGLGDLSEEALAAVSTYAPDAFYLGQQMKSMCESAGNNSSDKEDVKETDYFKYACKKGGNNWKTAIDKISKKIKKQIPERLSKYSSKIKRYIDDPSKSLPEKIEDDIFIQRIQALGELKDLNSRNYNKFSISTVKNFFADKVAEGFSKEITKGKLSKILTNKEINDCLSEYSEGSEKAKECKDAFEELNKQVELFSNMFSNDQSSENNLCNIDTLLKGKLFDLCKADYSTPSEIKTCIENDGEKIDTARESIKKLDWYANANVTFENILSIEKDSAWSEIGEKYQYTSCAHITGNSIQKGMFENMGQDTFGTQLPMGYIR